MTSPTQESDDKLAAQRRELDAMSDSLVNNLQAMIDEQTQRANELASHQHSLSAQASMPPLQRGQGKARERSSSLPPLPKKAPTLPPPPVEEEDRYVDISPTLTQLEEANSSDTPPTPWYGKQVLKKKPQEEKNNGVFSTICFIVIAFILLRCMS